MRNFKFSSIVLLFCITILLVFTSTSNAATPITTTNSTQIYKKASQNLINLKSFHMIFNITSDVYLRGSNINAVVNGEFDIEAKPLAIRTALQLTLDGGPMTIKKHLLQYIEESGKELIIYSNFENQWLKQVVPYSKSPNESEDILKGIISIIPISEDNTSIVFEVTRDSNYISSQLERSLAASGAPTNNLKTNLLTDFLKNAGNLKSTVTVDKKTTTISHITMDLSNFAFELGNMLAKLPDIPDAQKSGLKDILTNMQSTASISFSNFNNAEKIIIPENAKKATMMTVLPKKPAL